VDGLVTSDAEVGKLTLDRETWRFRISVIVKENISGYSGRRTQSIPAASTLEIYARTQSS
jgi:hypothetical protein